MADKPDKYMCYTVTDLSRSAKISVFYKETPCTLVERNDVSEGFRSRYSGTEEDTKSRFIGRPAIRLENYMTSHLDVYVQSFWICFVIGSSWLHISVRRLAVLTILRPAGVYFVTFWGDTSN